MSTLKPSHLQSETIASNWWFVRVLLRREDKTLEWQTRAAFKNQGEAELYCREWDGTARTEVFQPSDHSVAINDLFGLRLEL